MGLGYLFLAFNKNQKTNLFQKAFRLTNTPTFNIERFIFHEKGKVLFGGVYYLARKNRVFRFVEVKTHKSWVRLDSNFSAVSNSFEKL